MEIIKENFEDSKELEDVKEYIREIEAQKIEDEKTPLQKEWEEVKKMVGELEKYDKKDIDLIISLHSKEEVEEIREKFNEDFKDIADEDPLKLEVMSLLGKLGIDIYV